MQSSRSRREPAEQLAQAPVRLFRALRPLTFLTYAVNVLLLIWHLYPRRREFSHIHARTDYSAAVAAPAARLFGLQLLWDCRGDAIAEVEERLPAGVPYLACWCACDCGELRGYTKIAGQFCNTALFVTDELHRLHRDLVGNKPVEVVPCAAHEDLFFFDSDLRIETRSRLGYSEGEMVYIYSGSLGEYQCFNETVAHFAAYYQADPSSRLLVLTPAVEEARRALKDLPPSSYTVRSCTLEEVNAYLNAADVGFLLRKPIRTNHVASPTKFAEYGLSGLVVLTSDAVPWAHRIAIEAGNLAPIVDGLPGHAKLDRPKIASRFRALVGRETFVNCFRRLYVPEATMVDD